MEVVNFAYFNVMAKLINVQFFFLEGRDACIQQFVLVVRLIIFAALRY